MRIVCGSRRPVFQRDVDTIRDEEQPSLKEGHGPLCALCGRAIPPQAPQSLHHLVPKLKGGKGGKTVLLHHICHKEIHATLTEAELARHFDTPEKLRSHPHLAKFSAWVNNKPLDFDARTRKSVRRRKQR